jgi:hypothetical protein
VAAYLLLLLCLCVFEEKKMRMDVAKMKKSGGCVDSESWRVEKNSSGAICSGRAGTRGSHNTL